MNGEGRGVRNRQLWWGRLVEGRPTDYRKEIEEEPPGGCMILRQGPERSWLPSVQKRDACLRGTAAS